jgi:hypothetical protein
LINVTEKDVPPIQPARWAAKKPKTGARSVIALAGNLVREEDRRIKKAQNGRSAMQSKVQIDQALPQRRRPQASQPWQQ